MNKFFNLGVDIKNEHIKVLEGIFAGDSVTMRLTLSDCGKRINYTGVQAIGLTVRKGDYTTVETAELLRNIQRAEAENGIIEFELPQSFTADKGMHQLQLTLTAADGQMSCARINYIVTSAGEDAEIGEEDIKTYGELLTAVSDILDGEDVRINSEKARAQAEDERQTSEEKRQSAEKQRAVAEENRQSAESNRASAENERNIHEGNRVSAEAERAAAEGKRASAEADRASAEADRKLSENNRISAETDRNTAESNRQLAEDNRTAAESARAGAETQRLNSEKNRNTNESNRISAEKARAEAESARVQAEEQRALSESERRSAENERAAAETARSKAEAARNAAEEQRASAEGNRQSAENERVAAETERSEAEGNRAAEFTKMFEKLCPHTTASAQGATLTITDGRGDTKLRRWVITSGESGLGDLNEATGKYDIPITVSGKNMLPDISNPDVWSGASKTRTYSLNNIGLITGQSYTISVPNLPLDTGIRGYLYLQKKDGEGTETLIAHLHMASVVGTLTYTFTIEDGYEYFLWWYGDPNKLYNYKEVQIELGSTKTEYEPYGAPQTVTISLDSKVGANSGIYSETTGTDIPLITTGTNYITVGTTAVPRTIYVEYYQDINTVIKNINNQIAETQALVLEN